MKKVSLLVLVVLMVISLSSAVLADSDILDSILAFAGVEDPGVVAEDEQIASFKEAFAGDKEQGPVWYYLSQDSSGIHELYYTPDWGDNWQYSDKPQEDNVYYSLFDWEGLKASAGTWGDENIRTIIAWRAYTDGTAVIGEWDYTALDGENELEGTVDGAVINIIKADYENDNFTETTELFSAVTAAEGNVFEGTEVAVNEGDMIFFVFDAKNAPAANIKVEGISVNLN